MAYQVFDFKIDRGADFTFHALCEFNGLPIQLNGYAAELRLRRAHSDDAPVLTLTSANGELVLDNTTGAVIVTFSAAQTASLNGEYSYHLHIIAPNSVITPILEGWVTLDPLM